MDIFVMDIIEDNGVREHTSTIVFSIEDNVDIDDVVSEIVEDFEPHADDLGLNIDHYKPTEIPKVEFDILSKYLSDLTPENM
jgi:hypothetical protein